MKPIPLAAHPHIALLPKGYVPGEDDEYCHGCESRARDGDQDATVVASQGLVWELEFVAGDFSEYFHERNQDGYPKVPAHEARHGVVVWKGYCARCLKHHEASGQE